MIRLKTFLKRGVLVTAANWQVVVIQFVADALFKTLLAVPIVGGVFLAVLLIGGDPSELLELPVGSIIPTMTTVLLAQPLALGAFLFAVAIVLIGGSLLMFLVKGGTVAVLVAAERSAGPIEHPPLRLPAFRRAAHFSLEQFAAGAERLFRRYVVLGSALTIVYGVSTIASLIVIFGPAPQDSSWGLTAALSLVLVSGITIVNLLYLLLQIVVAVDDCTVPEAMGRVMGLVRAEFRTVSFIFLATLVLVVLTTAASILATAALGLIAFVPFIGLAALPLQLVAWVVRGIVFEFIGITALVAYVRVYRGLREEVTQSNRRLTNVSRVTARGITPIMFTSGSRKHERKENTKQSAMRTGTRKSLIRSPRVDHDGRSLFFRALRLFSCLRAYAPLGSEALRTWPAESNCCSNPTRIP